VALARLLAAAQLDLGGAMTQIVDQAAHGLGIALEDVGAGVDLRREDRHVRVKLPGPALTCKA